ncbi:hypothetical protein OJF2_17510 [Aquisphaera giovannonii]|uniref:Uncharacterized protein n=1 Tax=Aquisphaera giovannonii TaxID=406548 RepID=A0A5B9VZ43_9BACT|nr:hypothetical protein OJF2_17510 [Aquisphaera giovannonii]
MLVRPQLRVLRHRLLGPDVAPLDAHISIEFGAETGGRSAQVPEDGVTSRQKGTGMGHGPVGRPVEVRNRSTRLGIFNLTRW